MAASDPDPVPAPALEIDARGLRCPLPVLRVRKALEGLPEGAEVRVLTTDPMAAVDLPHFCAEAGHRLLEQEDTAEGHEFRLKKGGGRG